MITLRMYKQSSLSPPIWPYIVQLLRFNKEILLFLPVFIKKILNLREIVHVCVHNAQRVSDKIRANKSRKQLEEVHKKLNPIV